MTDTSMAQACEERLINVWPAVTTLLMEGWAIRFANGYSARANSASAIAAGAAISKALLAETERLFAAEGLTATVRVTPVAAAGTEKFLRAHGYTVKDEAVTMLRHLPFSGQADSRVVLHDQADALWLNGISAQQQASKRNPAHLHDIVSRIKLPAVFATLHDVGAPLGFGLAVVDRGFAELGSIMIDADHRGRGLGEAVVSSLLAWAALQGATNAFLQVDVENAPALKLYERLGFVPLYSYKTMIKA